MQPSQRRLWNALRQLQRPGLRFKREHRIGDYYMDIYCHAAKLDIEVDGLSHKLSGENDSFRDSKLAMIGIKTIRIHASELQGDVDSVANWVVQQCEERMGDCPHASQDA